MRELEGLSYREIGERMQLTRPGVESTLFRARRRLEDEFAELDTGRRCLTVRGAMGRMAEGTIMRSDRGLVSRHVRRCAVCRASAASWGCCPPSGRRDRRVSPRRCRCRSSPAPSFAKAAAVVAAVAIAGGTRRAQRLGWREAGGAERDGELRRQHPERGPRCSHAHGPAAGPRARRPRLCPAPVWPRHATDRLNAPSPAPAQGPVPPHPLSPGRPRPGLPGRLVSATTSRVERRQCWRRRPPAVPLGGSVAGSLVERGAGTLRGVLRVPRLRLPAAPRRTARPLSRPSGADSVPRDDG